ncbi:U3 small nucleolar RNA-associated protein NOL7 [Anomaloglossus baeobatrachus]|uniref:U3 small nucleolar RNA-associated protein NOL7 n=1 Tax=Anomaloglossus baeobatrachus TaxID=238106 RepID=UPI003F4FFD23
MTPEHELESEEDEAPEEVTFQNARSRAEESARVRRQAANREKALLKEKRKRKEELFTEQKKKKLLPDDVLQSISSASDKREKTSNQLEDQNKTGNEVCTQKKCAKELLPRKRLQDNYKVVQLEEYSARDLLQQRAKSFIQERLYGETMNRTTANEFLSVSRKRDVIKKPAVQFTDNNWGEDEKQRAAKFNLKWADKKL